MNPPVVLASTIRTEGGVWRHVLDLASGLRSRGCEVVMALGSDAVSLRQQAATLNYPVRGLAEPLRGAVWHLHLADTYDRKALPGMIAARAAGAAVVITEHLPRCDGSDPSVGDPQRSAWAWPAKTGFKRTQYGLCDRVVALSDASRRFIVTRYGVPSTKVVVIPNGIARHETLDLWPSGPARFVAVGSVIRQKGFDLLVDAVSHARVDWSVDVLGDGPHRGTLQQEADQAGAPVHFLGWSSQVDEAIAASHGVVIPSRWEAFPYVALEAMERGRPIVATRVDGLPEIVSDHVTGLLVGPEDPAALAEALDHLAGQPGVAEKMGHVARDHVARFGVDSMVDTTLETYLDVRPGRRRSKRGQP